MLKLSHQDFGVQMRQERAAPRAAMLIESMRDLGYSLPTALADIIDNSITAKARKIRLFADTTSSEPHFAIVDDGEGMTESDLLNAMRPGSRNPLESRSKNDLGRFGLGLKTASFSQCRRLTVVSRKAGCTACARWDLDHVAKSDEWLIDVFDDPSGIPCIEHLGPRGTIVLWEKLDRLIDQSGASTPSNLIREIDEAASHLELVFHRFLGDRGPRKIVISLNGRDLNPFDPFHLDHPATQADPEESIRVAGQDVLVQAFTLPHHKKVSAAEWERYSGREGYVKNQGFYVYRGKRLIIHGTWFGLARQMELTKLARVRIDMPNNLDADWKIDVKKASAQPPGPVRERLRRIIETIGATSKRVYTSRGQRLTNENRLPVWVRIQDKGEITYGLNSQHPVFLAFTDRLPIEMRSEFLKVLELAGATIPIDSLFADAGSNPDKIFNKKMSAEGLTSAIKTTIATLVATRLTATEIENMLSATEPFRSNWEETVQVLFETTRGEKQNE
jgi:hypothetical protein